MILVVCKHCKGALRVTNMDAQHSPLLGSGSDQFRCPFCDSKDILVTQGMYIDDAALGSLKIRDVSYEESFAALMGLGLPEESTCCVEVLTELFQSHGIALKGKRVVGATRVVIECMTLSDGTKVHFAASPMGATIYKISKPMSYVDRVEGCDGG